MAGSAVECPAPSQATPNDQYPSIFLRKYKAVLGAMCISLGPSKLNKLEDVYSTEAIFSLHVTKVVISVPFGVLLAVPPHVQHRIPFSRGTKPDQAGP